MIEKIMTAFRHHLKGKHDVELYHYQEVVAESIFKALIDNMKLTLSATEEQIKELKQIEIPIEFSRQSGKTTTIVHVIEFILIYFTEYFNRKIAIGIFAPQHQQAKTDFDRLKSALMKSITLLSVNDQSARQAKEESNASTIVLPNGSSCYIFSVTPTSKPESKTLDLIVFEEAQDVEDRIIKEQIWPMGKFTNAPRIYIGTAGIRICHFYNLIMSGKAFVLDFDMIAKEKRALYEKTGKSIHLIYEQSVKDEIVMYGRESDEIRRPYYLEWLIGTGQFVTIDALRELETERKYTQSEKTMECYAGIDTAKHPDSTVVTILRWNDNIKKKELINWLELRGENYKNQLEIIMAFLNRYNVLAVAIDSTGQGQFMPDWIKEETEWRDEYSGLYEVKFTMSSKDIMYRNLKNVIQDSLTTLPNLDTTMGRRFVEQMVNLQQQYKGQYLSVNHPDNDKAHDDYPDSWALAEYAFATRNATNNASIGIIDATIKERKVIKDDEGKITDYWPNSDW